MVWSHSHRVNGLGASSYKERSQRRLHKANGQSNVLRPIHFNRTALWPITLSTKIDGPGPIGTDGKKRVRAAKQSGNTTKEWAGVTEYDVLGNRHSWNANTGVPLWEELRFMLRLHQIECCLWRGEGVQTTDLGQTDIDTAI